MKLCKIFVLAFSLFAGLTAVGQATTTIHATGLNAPNKIIKCPANGLLVAEAGTMAANTGRISVVDRTSGMRHTLIAGLPSGVSFLGNPVTGDPDGPSGILLRGNTLFVTIGVGDAVMPGPGPGLELPAPAPSSPIFNSILEITLPGGFPSLDSSFTITPAHQTALAAGATVTISNLEGKQIDVRVIKNLPDYRPDPRPTAPNNVKASHLYGVEVWQKSVLVADAGHNNIKLVNRYDGSVDVLTEFPARPNPLFPGIGGPFIEAVPDNLHRFGNRLLVPLLTGFPFIVGGAEIQIVNLKGGESEVLIDGLSSAIDVLKAGDEEEELAAGFGMNDSDGAPRPIQGRSDIKLDLLSNPPIEIGTVSKGKPDVSAEVVASGEKVKGLDGPVALVPGLKNSYYTLEFSTDMRNGTPGRLRFYPSPTDVPLELVTNLITPTSMARDGDTGNIFITNIGPGTVTKVAFP